MTLLETDALDLSAALETGEISAVELMKATLARIRAVNGDVNAIILLRDEAALFTEAQAADNTPAKGWLHGIPLAVKDLADAKGLPTTKGSPIYRDHVADADGVMVARLRAAGALIIGKTNTPEFGLGSHTFNPVHGATRNPYDLSKSAGGSSGGAAAALAARMVSVADGSDMMGSLRNPAAWNNVYGMRPSWGLVPSDADGDMFLHQLSTAGPMARSPRDLAALLDTMAGRDPHQPHGEDHAKTLDGISGGVGGVRVGWLSDWGGSLPFEPGILSLCEAALARMADLGWQVHPVAAPFNSDAMWQSWLKLRHFSVAAGNHADYEDPAKRDLLKPAALWEISEGLKLSAMDVHRMSVIRSDWFRTATGLFENHDILVLPSTQVWPFDVEKIHPEEISGVAMDTYHRWMQVVVPASLIGLPVVNVPIGFGDAGLPMGVQLIGRRGSDGYLLQIAQAWHQATLWPQNRPPAL